MNWSRKRQRFADGGTVAEACFYAQKIIYRSVREKAVTVEVGRE